MRHIFIINPKAGKRNRSGEIMSQISALRSECGVQCDTIITTRPGHAREIAASAGASGEAVRLYACGGDGTLNEVISGAAGFGNVEITIVPTGTGNDFLRNFGEDAERFNDIFQLYDAPSAPMDLIDCNGRPAVTVVCAGLDASVAADVHKYSGLPLVSGGGSYIVSLMANFFFKSIGHEWTVIFDGEAIHGNFAALCVCNGRYYGGGFMPIGQARMDDGMLNQLLLRRVSRPRFLAAAADYSKGLWSKHPGIFIPRAANDIRLISRESVAVSIDGEIIRDTDLHIKLSDKKINFFAPLGASCNATAVGDFPAAAGRKTANCAK